MFRIIDGVAITEANRFSQFMKKREDLTLWHMDFQAAHIPCALVLTDKGYALYRTGMEDITDEVE